jgi:hypothetical protein
MKFALRVFVNQDLVREIALLKEGVYGRGSSVLDMHVMLPSHIVEKKRLVRRHAMYHDIPYQVELRYYTDQQQKVENWLNAIDVTYITGSLKKLQKVSRLRLLTLWTHHNKTLPYYNGKSYEI